MAQQHPQQRQDSMGQGPLGANYYPGGSDDFYIPVVSPLPQRNMPEMPDQIAQNLANLELGSHPQSPLQSPHSDSIGFHQQRSQSQPGSRRPSQQHFPPPEDEPSFSPFPPLRNRQLNVPPTDEDKELLLENACEQVLTSNDPEMQLAWAQDTLAYVDIAQQNEHRLSEFRPRRAQTPRIEHSLRTEAVNIVSFLAEQHHPKAEFLRGTWLEFGKFGFAMDKREAFRCYSRAANGGYARAEYRMGMQFESSNEIDKAIRHYNLGVQAGDAASNYRMGMMTLLGQHGQRQDFGYGLELIKYSAEHADENAPQGAYVYGMLFARELPQISIPDQFLPYDVNAARANIEKAAYLGFAKAQVKMGAAYELSELNCPFDPVLSLHYNNLAARQGEPDAEMAISKWFLSGYEGVFDKNEAMAFSYAQRAASSGLATAEFAMGYFYEVGIHVPTNIQEARVWYAKAAEHGNKDAAGRIEAVKRSKTLSRKDHERIALDRITSQRRMRADTGSASGAVNMPSIPGGYGGQGYIAAAAAGAAGAAIGTSYGNHGPRPAQSNPPYPAQQSQMPDPSQVRPPYAGSGIPPVRPGLAHGYSSPGPAGPPGGRPYRQSGPPMVPPAGSPMPPSGYPGGPGGFASGYPPEPPMAPPKLSVPYGSPGGNPGSPGLQNQIPRKPSPGGPQSLPMPGQFHHSSTAPNLGFSAPADYGGPDGRRLPSRNDGPGGSRPPPSRGGYGGPSGPVGHGTGTPGPGSSTGMRPPRGESLGTRPISQTQGPMTHPTPPLNAGGNRPPGPPSQPGGKRPGSSVPPPQAAPARPPGKGPSTFEEMGVPQTKKEQDCVIM